VTVGRKQVSGLEQVCHQYCATRPSERWSASSLASPVALKKVFFDEMVGCEESEMSEHASTGLKSQPLIMRNCVSLCSLST